MNYRSDFSFIRFYLVLVIRLRVLIFCFAEKSDTYMYVVRTSRRKYPPKTGPAGIRVSELFAKETVPYVCAFFCLFCVVDNPFNSFLVFEESAEPQVPSLLWAKLPCEWRLCRTRATCWHKPWIEGLCVYACVWRGRQAFLGTAPSPLCVCVCASRFGVFVCGFCVRIFCAVAVVRVCECLYAAGYMGIQQLWFLR